jgi:hypothetical protein
VPRPDSGGLRLYRLALGIDTDEVLAKYRHARRVPYLPPRKNAYLPPQANSRELKIARRDA